MTVIGTCRLCERDGELRESHIIPRFVTDHQKESSATGFLRTSACINRRVQDGTKLYMLCPSCEGMFNQWETSFANKIYHPWSNREAPQLFYGPWMLKFAVSVSWRVLTWYMDYSAELVSYTTDAQRLISDALLTWKHFLFDEIPNPREYEQHMMLFDAIESATHPHLLPPNINRFVTRGMHINLAHSNGHPLFIYTKMGKITLLGFLGINYHRQWVGTKLQVKNGKVGGNITLPSQFADYLNERAQCTQDEYAKLSQKQTKVIEKTFETNADRAARSESLQMMTADVEMFGIDKVFQKRKRSEQEN